MGPHLSLSFMIYTFHIFFSVSLLCVLFLREKMRREEEEITRPTTMFCCKWF